MSTINRFYFSTVVCLLSTAMTACNQNIDTEDAASATDDDDFFGTSTGDASDTEAVPTTSAGDPSGGDPTEGSGGVDPSDFCKLHPSDEYAGFVHVCGGKVEGGLAFDYFGDPELPIDMFFFCTDRTEPPWNLEKPAGYVSTCLRQLPLEFGPNVPSPNGHQVDACCLRDSPFEATSAYCRIDAAEEFCAGASDGLNQLRAELPVIPLLAEVNHQLENLNKFIADASTQTSCSQHLGQGFLEEGDFNSSSAKVSWTVDHPQALDPEVGWPWFRDIRTNVFEFGIEASENSGLSCSDLEGDAVTGVINEGTVTVDSHLGEGTTTVSGRMSYNRSDCRLASCEFKLETFEMQVDDFVVGALSFSDISIALAAPSVGLINGDKIVLPEHQMRLTATFKLTAEGKPQFDGAPVSVGLRNNDVAELRLLPDSSIAVDTLNVSQWPFEMAIVSEVSR